MSIKAAVLIVSLLLFSTIGEAATPVRRCSGDYPFPLSVQIENCYALPCTVIRGQITQMDVQFVADKDDTYDIQADVRATVFGLTVPYPLAGDSGDVCKNLLHGAYCPLYEGEDVTYHIDFPVESTVPEVNCKAELRLLDVNKQVVSCFIADLKVKRAK